ncbi:MAG: GNAT family N-acetyltransferase [Pseudomonadota bacterium]|nr:GNAT family N-acetyltransferase [Pseudomonadota bacterium]
MNMLPDLPIADPRASPAVDETACNAEPAHARPGRAWVPIRSLSPRHRQRIAAHLIALDGRSRYLRFGYAANDTQIKRYVDTLDFEHDEVFGIFNRRLELIALAHLAHRDADALRGREAASEFGVSVLPKARRRGFGRRLFEHAMLHARNRHVQTMFIHALSENTAMLKLARSAGATIERDGSESEAWLKLPPDSLASHLDQLLVDGAAEIDYRMKEQARRAGAEPTGIEPTGAEPVKDALTPGAAAHGAS